LNYSTNKVQIKLYDDLRTVRLPAFCWAATIKSPWLHKFLDLSLTFGLFSRLFTDLSRIPWHFHVSRNSRKAVIEWTQQRHLLRVLVSSTEVCHLSCTTICTGSTFQSASPTSWTLLCIAACRRKLRGTWSTVAHQFRKSPAVDNYAQSVDNTLLWRRVIGWTRSGALGSILRGTIYRIVSVIPNSVWAVSGNYFKRGIICELLNTLSAIEMLDDSALYKFTIDIYIDIDKAAHAGESKTTNGKQRKHNNVITHYFSAGSWSRSMHDAILPTSLILAVFSTYFSECAINQHSIQLLLAKQQHKQIRKRAQAYRFFITAPIKHWWKKSMKRPSRKLQHALTSTHCIQVRKEGCCRQRVTDHSATTSWGLQQA